MKLDMVGAARRQYGPCFKPSYSFDGMGSVGPATAADGAILRFRQGRTGEMVHSNLRGQFSEASQRGKIFMASTPAAGVTVPIFSNTTQQCVLYNPVGSNKKLSILRTQMGYVSGTMVAGHFCYAVNTLLSNAVTGTATTLVQNGYLVPAGSAGGSGILYTAATVTALTYMMNIGWSQVVQAATATNTPWTMVDFLDGLITIPPGGCLAVAANVAAAVVANISLIWEETSLDG